MTHWVVLPAAGSGSRFGGGRPKQYERLHGATVLEHSIAPFLHGEPARHLQGIVVVLAAGDSQFANLPLMQRMATAAAGDVAGNALISTAIGGATRAESVLAGLRAIAERGAAAEDWVLVHDAARPCLSVTELRALLAALESPEGTAHGALLALPVADTVKRAAAAASAPRVAATISRDGLWRALTPQAFRLGTLQGALERALSTADANVPTDESAAVEALGLAPVLVPGSPYNVKVTLPADLAFAAMVLRSREEDPADAD